ncbi:MAG: DUF1641 domain-containing protein [Bacteroidota bacterium]
MDTPPDLPSDLDAETVRGLARLAARAGEIEALLDGFGALVARGPTIAEGLNDTVEQVRQSSAGGDGAGAYAEHLPRLRALASPESAAHTLDAAEALSGALADPEVKAFLQSDLAASLAALSRIAGRLDDLEGLIDGVFRMIERGPQIAESLNDTVIQIRRDTAKGGGPLGAYGPAIEQAKAFGTPERIEGLLRAGAVFQDAFESEGVQSLLNSTILDPDAVETVGDLAGALITATQEAPAQQPEIKGPLSLVKALRDPYVSRALSFGLGVARAFGRQLEQQGRGPQTHS